MIPVETVEDLVSTAFPGLATVYGLPGEYRPVPDRIEALRGEIAATPAGPPADALDRRAATALRDALATVAGNPTFRKPFEGLVRGTFASSVSDAPFDHAGDPGSLVETELSGWSDAAAGTPDPLYARRFADRVGSARGAVAVLDDRSHPAADDDAGHPAGAALAPVDPEQVGRDLRRAYRFDRSADRLRWRCEEITRCWNERLRGVADLLRRRGVVEGDSLAGIREAVLAAPSDARIDVEGLCEHLSSLPLYPHLGDAPVQVSQLPEGVGRIATEGEVFLWDLVGERPRLELYVEDAGMEGAGITLVNVLAHELAHADHGRAASALPDAARARQLLTSFSLPMAEGYAVAVETAVCCRLAAALAEQAGIAESLPRWVHAHAGASPDPTAADEAIHDLVGLAAETAALAFATEAAYWRVVRGVRGLVDLRAFTAGEPPSEVVAALAADTALPESTVRSQALPFLDRPGEGASYPLGAAAYERYRYAASEPRRFDERVVGRGFMPFAAFLRTAEAAVRTG